MRDARRKDAVIKRRGMTLVELLVVMAIIMLLAAATIPRLRPEMNRSRIREAARSVQLYLSTARNQAIATGRSCGVMLERLPAEPGCSMSLAQVETTIPYGGDLVNATATVSAHQVPGSSLPKGLLQMDPNTVYAVANISFDKWPTVPLYPGDLIQINYQGFRYTVAPASLKTSSGATPAMNALNGAGRVLPNGTALVAYVDVSHGEQCAFLTQPFTGSYEIMRWPNKSSTAALQLPSPAVIDLTLSGRSSKQRADDPANDPITGLVWASSVGGDTTPVTIMFAPDGSVDRVYVANKATRPVTPIALLIGKRENVNDPTGVANLQDLNNLWVAINPMTGMIITTDIIPWNANAVALKQRLFDSRYYVQQSSPMGGK
jgi:prepilin-type N-terminal cleavage/methylation domain-containing protein